MGFCPGWGWSATCVLRLSIVCVWYEIIDRHLELRIAVCAGKLADVVVVCRSTAVGIRFECRLRSLSASSGIRSAGVRCGFCMCRSSGVFLCKGPRENRTRDLSVTASVPLDRGCTDSQQTMMLLND